MQSMSAIGVPATIDDEEEEDEQQLRKQVQDLESNNKHLKTQLETLKTENNELSLEIRSYKGDKSYGELMSLKQQYENARAEAQRAEQSYKRVLDEMEQLQGQIAGHNQEQSVLKSRIEEQLAIHGHLKQRLEASQKTTEIANLTEQLDKKSIGAFEQQIQKLELANRELTAKVAGYDLEKETLVFTRQQAEKEHQNALKQTKIQERHKSNEQLKADAEREQLLSQLQDDMKMLKIASDTKDETLQTHLQRIKQLELQLLKSNQVDRIQELDQRIRNQSQQLVELGQDKRLLMDEVADLRNQLDTTSHKFKIVSEQHKEAKQALDKAQKEATKFKEQMDKTICP
ncbi:hypothetical protein EDD86DRAFT_244256 [Gorgonomyces haynaldii]|nr:hypothetical protein EDD86DRAFT_244256 [Gorgonomyces haynaldii]